MPIEILPLDHPDYEKGGWTISSERRFGLTGKRSPPPEEKPDSAPPPNEQPPKPEGR
jgi:hypothetical protein